MAQYNATLYKNTGFNTVDLPDTPALVETFTSVSASVLFLKQNAPITSVKIQKSFNDVKNCDYMKIGNMFYFLTDIKMLNDNVCEAHVVEDSITSLGGPAVLNFIDGWCERKHVSSDGLFENLYPENFAPKKMLELDFYSSGHLGDYSTGETVLIASTVDLTDPTWNDAEIYVGQAGGQDYEVTVPSIPGASSSTKISIYEINSNADLDAFTPGYGLYDYTNNRVKLAVEKLRALGLETVLVGCYRIPTFLIDTITDAGDGFIQTLKMKEYTVGFQKVDEEIAGTQNGKLAYGYGTYTPANNKVYSQYNDLTIFSLSGDRKTYRMADIKDDTQTITAASLPGFKIVSNGAPNGKPYMRPLYFEGQGINQITVFDNAVQGSTWLNTPLVLEGASGNAINAANATIQRNSANMAWDRATYNRTARNIADDLSWGARNFESLIPGLSTAGNLSSGKVGMNHQRFDTTGLGTASSFSNVYSNIQSFDPSEHQRELDELANNIMGQKLAYEISQNIVAPEVKFNQDMTLQMYLGNAFYGYTERLSDEDLERFDKYLTLYGYSTSEPLTTACFTGRTNFNFVQATGVSIEKTTSATYAENDNRMRRILAAKQLSAGCRFWHVKPDSSKRFVNPIASNT